MNDRLLALCERPGLDERDRLLALLGASASPAGLEHTDALARAAWERGLSLRETYEVVLQGVLFAGYPLAIEALRAHAQAARMTFELYECAEVFAQDALLAEYDPSWPGSGRALFERLYGARADGVREELAKASPEIARWAIVEGYGRVLGRPGLSTVQRELAVLTHLTALGVPRQLAGHTQCAREIGIADDAIREALYSAMYFGVEDAVTNALLAFDGRAAQSRR